MKTLLFAMIALLGITVWTPEAQAGRDCDRDHRYSRSHRHHRHYYPRYYTSRPRHYHCAPVRYYSAYPRYYYPRSHYYRPGISVSFGF